MSEAEETQVTFTAHELKTLIALAKDTARREGIEEAAKMIAPPEDERVKLTDVEDRAFWAAIAQAEDRLYKFARSLNEGHNDE